MTSKAERAWTIVQHSAYGYGDDPDWERAVESRLVGTLREQVAVAKLGGILFGSYKEAEDFVELANYPDKVRDLTPRAKGTFSDAQIDGLRIYIPVRKAIG